MLYEVITRRRPASWILAEMQRRTADLAGLKLEFRGQEGGPTEGNVITSYSIHYTKLYDDEGKLDKLYVVSNDFVNTMTQKPAVEQLLPLQAGEDEEKLSHHWDYIYEPDAKELLDGLLKRYIESLVYQAVVENNACEQAARMLAMKNATDNA